MILLIILLIILIRYWLYVLYYKKFKKYKETEEKLDTKEISIKFFKKTFKTLIILFILLTTFIVYQSLTPAYFKAHILKWKKDIIFIEMSHIASEDFYKKVNDLITEKTSEWYKLYFEAVDTSWVSNQEIKDNLWIWLSENTYKLFEVLNKNIKAQDNTSIIESSVSESKNVDLNFSDLLNQNNSYSIYKTSFPSKKTTILHPFAAVSTELTEEHIEQLEEINPIYKFVIWNLIKSYVNFLIKNERIYEWNAEMSYTLLWYLNWKPAKEYKDFFNGKILDMRNKHLAEEVANSSDTKIIITYWKLHYKWFLEEYKKIDPTIKEIDYIELKVF